jgi:photosynthetic reaction center H subunit
MGTGAITSYVDVAQLVLYAFWIFFAGVIYYLVRENRREGYPLETWRGDAAEGWIPMPEPKTYRLASGEEVQAPSGQGPLRNFSAERVHGSEGTPLEPVGNPLRAGVGPGAWTERADHPDLDSHGQPKIRPLSQVPECNVSDRDPDPRGMTLVDANDDPVGTVRDLWIDAPEMVFRYLDVELADGSRRALVPMTFCRVTRERVKVHALLASQWAGVPATRSSSSITLLEEEKISAYFGAGLLYAEPSRLEPLV